MDLAVPSTWYSKAAECNSMFGGFVVVVVVFCVLVPCLFFWCLVSWSLFLVPLCFSTLVAFIFSPCPLPLLPCGVLIPRHVVERHPFGVCCGLQLCSAASAIGRWLPRRFCLSSGPKWLMFCCGQRCMGSVHEAWH